MRSSLCSFLGGALSRKRRAAENEGPEQTEQGTCGEDDGETRLLAIGGKDVEKFPHRETGVADTVLMMVWRLVKRARICSSLSIGTMALRCPHAGLWSSRQDMLGWRSCAPPRHARPPPA